MLDTSEEQESMEWPLADLLIARNTADHGLDSKSVQVELGAGKGGEWICRKVATPILSPTRG